MARLNNKTIDQSLYGTYIVLEAGPTHNGLESAKALAKAAKGAGADSVKFQLLYADRLMADKSLMFSYSYLEINSNGEENYVEFSEPLYDILKRRELNKQEWKELKNYCDEIDIHMFTTATYEDEVDFIVDELGMDSIKINSSDVTDLEFIDYCARKGVNIQLDTGNADIWEIEKAVITAENAGCENIIIHHCPSGYPAHVESIFLRQIATLKTLFPKYAIAFSDHSPGWDMDIAAVALGADMIEKTITLDRTIKSCEHSFSLEPDDAKRLTLELQTKIYRDYKKENFYEEVTSRVYPPTTFNPSSGTLMSFEAVDINAQKGEATAMHYHPGQRSLHIITTNKAAGVTLNFCGIAENPDEREDSKVHLDFPNNSMIVLNFPPYAHHKFHGEFVCLSVHPREGKNLIEKLRSGDLEGGFLESATVFSKNNQDKDQWNVSSTVEYKSAKKIQQSSQRTK